MKNFTFCSPTEVIFGQGMEEKVGEAIKKHGGRRVFVVYGGGSAIKSGLLERIQKSLEKYGLPYMVLGGVKPNPRLSLARTGVRQAVMFEADFLLAVGGGSVIDTAKGIAHGAANPATDIWDFWLKRQPLAKSLPIGVVLTIPAAGSETSDSAVLTNEETGEKRGLGTDFNRPRFAIMNPELTFTLPKQQIAYGIVDIMMHTLDRYFTPTEGNELTDGFAESLLRTTIRNGGIAIENQRNYQAMSELMWCGSLSHNGLTGLGAEKDFAPHKLGHELSGKFDVAHGASLAAIWGAWARYVYSVKPERFARYAAQVWGIEEDMVSKSALAGIDATVAFFKSLGAPVCFTELGIGIQSDETLQELANRCTGGGQYSIAAFKKIDRADAYAIYKAANV